MQEVLDSVRRFYPEVALTVGLLLVVLVDSTGARARNVVNWWLTVATLAAALVLCVPLARVAAGPLFGGMLVLDPMAVFFKVLLVAASLVVVGAFRFDGSRELAGLGRGEFYALLLAVTLSNLLLATAGDLAMLYLALEMVSITSYVRVA